MFLSEPTVQLVDLSILHTQGEQIDDQEWRIKEQELLAANLQKFMTADMSTDELSDEC